MIKYWWLATSGSHVIRPRDCMSSEWPHSQDFLLTSPLIHPTWLQFQFWANSRVVTSPHVFKGSTRAAIVILPISLYVWNELTNKTRDCSLFRYELWTTLANTHPSSVKKEFVDPEEQELGELDTFLLEHAETLPKDHITLIQKIGNGQCCRYISFCFTIPGSGAGGYFGKQ